MFSQTQRFADRLNAHFIVVHPGDAGGLDETVKQINNLNDSRLVVENMPLVSMRQTRCVGHNPDELKAIKEGTGLDVCVDVVHSAKAAYANGEKYLDYYKRFLALRPKVVHLVDSSLSGCFDEHLNFGDGELDFSILVPKAIETVPDVFFTLETPNKSISRLSEYKKNRMYLENVLRRQRL